MCKWPTKVSFFILVAFWAIAYSECMLSQPGIQLNPGSSSLSPVKDKRIDDGVYRQMYRSQYHFSPQLVDRVYPSNLVYFRKAWHIFYKYHLPNGSGWGHAESVDLLHWKHRPAAAVLDTEREIYFGSGVVDRNDSSGLFSGKPGYLGFYAQKTSDRVKTSLSNSIGFYYSREAQKFEPYTQQLAVSYDGQTSHEPIVLPEHPKVFWHAPSQRWIMMLSAGALQIYSSSDLKKWRLESIDRSISTEHGDLFPLALDKDPSKILWVLSLSGRHYIVGNFDGKKFSRLTSDLVMNYGPDSWASSSWNHSPQQQRVMISSLYSPGYAGEWPDRFAHSFTAPIALSLVSTDAGPRLLQMPIADIAKLRGQPWTSSHWKIEGVQVLPDVRSARTLDIEIDIDVSQSDVAGINVLEGPDGSKVSIAYDTNTGEIFLDRRQGMWPGLHPISTQHRAPLPLKNGRLSLRILLDHSSIEIFANQGEAVITAMLFAQPAAKAVSIFSEGGESLVHSLAVFPMKSIWKTKKEFSKKPSSKKQGEIHSWPSRQLRLGEEAYLGADTWVSRGDSSGLQWTVNDAGIIRVNPQGADNWIQVKAQKLGETDVIAAIPGTGISSATRITVVPNKFISNVEFLYSDARWSLERDGLAFIGEGHDESPMLAKSLGEHLIFEVDISFSRARSSASMAGVFIRSAGQGRFGYFIRLFPGESKITVGPWRGSSLTSKRFSFDREKTYRLRIENHKKGFEKRLHVSLDGVRVIDIAEPLSLKLAKRMGLTASGRASFQNVKLKAWD